MIVFDLDDTLRSTEGSCAVTPKTRGLDPDRAENWLVWQDYVNQFGKPIDHVVKLYEHFLSLGEVVILTSSQQGTIEWLEEHKISIPDKVIERDANDHRHPTIYKGSYLSEWKDDIVLWVDDDNTVCDMVETHAIPVVRVKDTLS